MIFLFDFHRCSQGPPKIRRQFRNKSRSILKLSKNVYYKKCGPKLIFFNEKKIRKIRMFFDIEKWFWRSDLGTFWQPMWTSVKVKWSPCWLTSAKLHHWGHTNMCVALSTKEGVGMIHRNCALPPHFRFQDQWLWPSFFDRISKVFKYSDALKVHIYECTKNSWTCSQITVFLGLKLDNRII